MKISKLHVSNYRCFDNIQLDNLGKIVCLVGANGSGKSSILDLIIQVCGTKRGRHQFESKEWKGKIDGKTLVIEYNFSRKEKGVFRLGSHPQSGTIRVIHLEPMVPDDFGTQYHNFDDLVLDNTRSYFIYYSPIRSFQLENLGESRLPSADEGLYILPQASNYQNRARLLTSLMTQLLHRQREELVRKVQSGKNVDSKDYMELDIVHDVFNRFFKVTGKTFLTPETSEDGRTSYWFKTPWSIYHLPLSALSSGEQWLLFFFLEMKLNNWKNHVILIDEIENHLHPKLALEFVKELKSIEDDNQYWITTHSPTIARYLNDSTWGLVLNDENKTEVVDSNSMELLSSLTGHDAVIPIGKTIVLLEGSKIPGQSRSIDETFFEELYSIGINLEHVHFVSIGHVGSLMDMGQALPDFERSLGLNWKVYAIRDRDAISDRDRINAMKTQNGRLYIWNRSSIEGYLIEPVIIRYLLQSKRVKLIPNESEIESEIIHHILNHKESIINRFTNHLVYLQYPTRGHSTIKWLQDASSIATTLQSEIDDFKLFVDQALSSNDWRKLLPYVDCKELAYDIYGKYLQDGVNRPQHFVDLVRSIMRDVIKEKIGCEEDKLAKLSEIWPEVSNVLKHLSEGLDFTT